VKIRSGLETNVSLESVAITDIVLNLFIFFFTAFSLLYTFNPARESSLAVTLPQAGARPAERGREPLVVTVAAGGEFLLGADAVPRRELAAALSAALERGPGRPVVVRADRLVPLETVVEVLELARDAGAAEAGIAVRERAAAPGPLE
jgi:biopolymer transport protein ExbD